MTSTDRPASRPVVLIAIDWYLPAYRAGGPIRSIANLVATLGKEIDFHIVCGNKDLGSPHPLPVPESEWTTVGNARALYLPAHEQRPEMWKRLLHDIQPDRLYLNSLYSGPFSRMPWGVASEMGVPTTLAPRGMLGSGALSIKPWRKKAWLWLQRLSGRYEGLTWHASTEQEADEIRNWFPNAEIHTALNLPVPFEPLPQKRPAEPDGAQDSRQPVQLLSVGRVHPIKNYAFGVQLAANLASGAQPVVYRIVGPVEHPSEADRLQSIADQSEHLTLELAGATPPADIQAHFGWAHLVLVPSFNENFGHAVAEAVACARPAIVSDQTAWSTMEHGHTVRCLPLDLNSWTNAAIDLLGISQEDVVESARNTHARCLLSASHLAAQRALFS